MYKYIDREVLIILKEFKSEVDLDLNIHLLLFL